jgi:hypothetical protein
MEKASIITPVIKLTLINLYINEKNFIIEKCLLDNQNIFQADCGK